jgi:hypothetical protein
VVLPRGLAGLIVTVVRMHDGILRSSKNRRVAEIDKEESLIYLYFGGWSSFEVGVCFVTYIRKQLRMSFVTVGPDVIRMLNTVMVVSERLSE